MHTAMKSCQSNHCHDSWIAHCHVKVHLLRLGPAEYSSFHRLVMQILLLILTIPAAQTPLIVDNSTQIGAPTARAPQAALLHGSRWTYVLTFPYLHEILCGTQREYPRMRFSVRSCWPAQFSGQRILPKNANMFEC